MCDKNPSNKKSKSKQIELGCEHGVDEEVYGLRNSTLNANEVRDALSQMIIMDELSFRFVEQSSFWQFLGAACPAFHIPSRTTVARDCYQLYLNESMRDN